MRHLEENFKTQVSSLAVTYIEHTLKMLVVAERQAAPAAVGCGDAQPPAPLFMAERRLSDGANSSVTGLTMHRAAWEHRHKHHIELA